MKKNEKMQTNRSWCGERGAEGGRRSESEAESSGKREWQQERPLRKTERQRERREGSAETSEGGKSWGESGEKDVLHVRHGVVKVWPFLQHMTK